MKSSSGTTLIEILISITIFAIFTTSILVSLSSLGFVEVKNKRQSEATLLAQQGVEISYNLSINQWNYISALNGTYHPQLINNYYVLYPGPDITENNYSRYITVSPVYRDDQGLITSSGTIDNNTIQITSTVTWLENSQTKSVSLNHYLINQYFDNP